MSKQTLVEKLSEIQKLLKAPKSQFNKFGNYAYRNQEDILEAVKPLLAERKLVMTISDEICGTADRIYVRATVTVTDGENSVTNTAFAREPQEQKGMNEAQITGSASSYARKYALNGMFLIDDTKDADATNTHGKEEKPVTNIAGASKDQTAKAADPKPEEKKSGFKPKNQDTKPAETKPKNPPMEPVTAGDWD